MDSNELLYEYFVRILLVYISICKKFDLIRDAFSLNLQINTQISTWFYIRINANKTIK